MGTRPSHNSELARRNQWNHSIEERERKKEDGDVIVE